MDRPVIALSMNFMRLGSHHQFHIRGKYIDAVFGGGALPLPVPCLPDKESLRQYLSLAGALIIIGGLDYPPSLYHEELHPMAELAHERRVQSDLLLLEIAIEMKLPILGICAGMQLLNVYFGGKLIQHLEPTDIHLGETYHPIHITGGRWLPQIYSDKTITVNSNHHQAVHPQYLGRGLSVVASAEDGIIEAIEYDSPQMVLGIQWHPERIADPLVGKVVFQFLTRLAKR